jgi:hypothetical protein
MAIKTVSDGGNFLGQAASKKIFDAYHKNKKYNKKLLVNPLTKREMEIYILASESDLQSGQTIGKSYPAPLDLT